MACQSFHQVEIEGDHKYLTYIVITLPDAYMYVLCNTEQTSALSDSTIFANERRIPSGKVWWCGKQELLVFGGLY